MNVGLHLTNLRACVRINYTTKSYFWTGANVPIWGLKFWTSGIIWGPKFWGAKCAYLRSFFVPKNLLPVRKFWQESLLFRVFEKVNLIIWLEGLRKILDMGTPVLIVKDPPPPPPPPPQVTYLQIFLGSFDFMVQNSKSSCFPSLFSGASFNSYLFSLI